MRIKEIEARLAAIKQEIETRGAEMTAAEIDALFAEYKQYADMLRRFLYKEEYL